MGFLRSFTTAALSLSLLVPSCNANINERQAPGPPSTFPAGWSYKGCYTDNVGNRTLKDAFFSGSQQNSSACIQFCTGSGYSLAGTEYGSECYCGNTIAGLGALDPNGAGCTTACSGASGEACGGPNRLSVYNRTGPPPAQSSAVVIIEDGTDHVWIGRGCYSDSTSARILSLGVAPQGGSQNNSAQSCTAECKRRSFIYAGTEYGGECYCGNTLSNNQGPKSDGCNMKCNGNSTQICGGANRINIYGYISKAQLSSTSVMPTSTPLSTPTSTAIKSSTPVSTLVSTSSPLSSPLASSTASVSPVKDVVTTPISSAQSSGSAVTSSIPTSTPKLGWYYEGCYVDNAGGRSLPYGTAVQGMMTNANCQAACRAAGYILAGTEYAGECYCGNALQAGGAPAPDGEAKCNMACKGNATEMCGGPDRLTLFRFYSGNGATSSSALASSVSSSAAPLPTGLPSGFGYKGCYVDGPGYRIMQNQQPDDSQMTITSCSNKCVGLGYDVAAMEYGTQCFCDTMLRMNATLAKTDAECNVNCGGNSAQKCGGGNRMSVYSSQKSLKIIGAPAPIKKVGDWTYQGCATSFGGQWDKPLPWKLSNQTGNSPEWCLSRCQKYGYMAAGMEYGVECYCGDIDHMVAKGSQPAPESDCNTPCPGNPEALCGQGNRLTWYKYTGDQPLYVFDYPQGTAAGRYEFLVGGPIIPLISQPLVNGKVSLVEKHGTGPGNSTGAYEFDPSIGSDIFHAFREMQGLKTDVFCSSSLTLPDRAGRVINIGGWSGDSLYGVRLFTPDGKLGVNGNNGWQENFKEISLQTTRWYPTSLIMPNGSILVVGGENGSNGPPVPNMEILPKVGPLKFAQWLLDTDPNNLYPFLAVLPSGGIFVQYYNEARILDERTLDTIKILPKTPATVNSDTGGRTYPMEGSMMLLPQSAPYTDPLEVLICGGAGADPGPVWGIDNCITTQPDAPNPVWTIERMPSRRVMTCMTTLPDGTFMILNGAEEGVAGFGLANVPNLNALIYDSRKPKHHRISVMANTTIARMYHSEAVLLDDGRVLVSGSDPEDDTHPQEYRVEVFIPPYLTSGKPRPSFTIDNKDWTNGATYPFVLTAGSSNIKVSLLGSEASTHGNSMGARILYPAFQCGGSSCTVTAPPGPYVAPAGWYRMFVLADDIPSYATWVRIGGDPGQIGNWPDFADFKPLPGIGPVNQLSSQRSATQNATARKFRA